MYTKCKRGNFLIQVKLQNGSYEYIRYYGYYKNSYSNLKIKTTSSPKNAREWVLYNGAARMKSIFENFYSEVIVVDYSKQKQRKLKLAELFVDENFR